MKIEIKFDESNLATSRELEELQDLLENEDLVVEEKTEFLEGTRGDVIIALEIAKFVIPSLTSVLLYWYNQKTKRTVKVTYKNPHDTIEEIVLTEENPDEEAFLELFDNLNKKNADLEVTLSDNNDA